MLRVTLAILWLAAAAVATSAGGGYAHHDAQKPLYPGTYSLTWSPLRAGCSLSGRRSGHLQATCPPSGCRCIRFRAMHKAIWQPHAACSPLPPPPPPARGLAAPPLARLLPFPHVRCRWTISAHCCQSLPFCLAPSMRAAAVEARACPMAAVAHWGGDSDDSWHHQPPSPVCGNTGPVFLNTTHDEQRERHCQGWGCPRVNPLQRWVVRLPPWVPPGATLPGRLLTMQVSGGCLVQPMQDYRPYLHMFDQAARTSHPVVSNSSARMTLPPHLAPRLAPQSVGRTGTPCKTLLAAPTSCSDICNLYFSAPGDPAAAWLLEALPGNRYLLRAEVRQLLGGGQVPRQVPHFQLLGQPHSALCPDTIAPLR